MKKIRVAVEFIIFVPEETVSEEVHLGITEEDIRVRVGLNDRIPDAVVTHYETTKSEDVTEE